MDETDEVDEIDETDEIDEVDEADEVDETDGVDEKKIKSINNLMETKHLRFEDLDVWKESMRICKEVYVLLKDCKDYGFKDQIQRAAVSIPSNIAEGYERKGKKEKIQFLYISKGSAAEVRTQLYLAISLEYIDKLKGMELVNQLTKLSIMIYNFISTLNKTLHG